MKSSLIAGLGILLFAMTSFGQGRVGFNNYVSGNAVTVGPLTTVGQGAMGQFVGSSYSAQLFWAPQGSYATESAFLAALAGRSAPVAFLGTTGGSPDTDGAGLFEGGTVPDPVGTAMPVGSYTMLVLAWYNGGSYPSFNAALAGLANVGGSSFFDVTATASPSPANNTIFPAFVLGSLVNWLPVPDVPEPGTLAFTVLGATLLWTFRRQRSG